MRKGISGVTWSIFGMLLGLIVLIVYVQIFGLIESSAEKDIESLQSCDQGLVGSLAGTEGKCFPRKDCRTLAGHGGDLGGEGGEFGGAGASGGWAGDIAAKTNSYKWQLLGEGYGCPEEKTDDGGPFCCILVPSGADRPSWEHAYCGMIEPGDFAIKKEKECFRFEKTVYADEQIEIRYHVPEGEQCEGTVTLKDSSGTTIEERQLTCNLDGLRMTDTKFHAYEWAEDNSLLNDGGTVEVEAGGTSETFRIRPVTDYCSLDSVEECRGWPANQVRRGDTETFVTMYCVPRSDWDCELTERAP